MPFEWLELKTDEQARKAGLSGLDDVRLPACLFPADILLAREGVGGDFSTRNRIGYLADGTRIVGEGAMAVTFVHRYLSAG